MQNLNPQEIAIAAFLHIPEKHCEPKFPGMTIPYLIVLKETGIVRYTWRTSSRSLSGQCLDAFFGNAHQAQTFAQKWAKKLPKACRGVLIRKEKGKFRVSIPCVTVG